MTTFELQSSFPHGVAGVMTTFPGSARSLVAPALASDGAVVQATIRGTPGSTVWTLRSPAPESVFSTLLYGTVAVGASPRTTFAGTLPASGTLAVDLALPPLAPGQAFASWIVQSLQNDGTVPYVSSPSLVDVVPAGTPAD